METKNLKNRLEIKKLSPDLLDDWLHFFDDGAFTDNDEWSGCYCMCYHWTKALNKKKEWNCSRENGPYNRRCAADFIKKGKMQGYLAYFGQSVVGWCNANDKSAYDSVNFNFTGIPGDTEKKVKSVVCFCILPAARGQGVASALLERVCTDAAAEGYDSVEAYPFHHDDNNAYHGPQSMYEKAGFEKLGSAYDCSIFRKTL